MFKTNRRIFLQSFAAGAGTLAASQSFATGTDGHAAGYDVSAASEYLKTIPRKSGDPVVFTASLDKGPIKATSGGWAREVTMRGLPIATDIAGAHLFMNAGGSREMHWHNSAEWAYIVDGHCQVTVVDPESVAEVVNLGPGDLWYFPKGHGHAIQTLGPAPCHAILAFDDGLYSEHGTFGISDWMSRYNTEALSQAFGVSAEAFAQIPKAETYIMQGDVLPLDGPQARSARELDHARTHRYALMAQKPRVSTPGGALYIASSKEFPMSTTLTGMVLKLKRGAMHEPHWHTDANEWHYVLKGRTRSSSSHLTNASLWPSFRRANAPTSRAIAGTPFKTSVRTMRKSSACWTALPTTRARCRIGWQRRRGTCWPIISACPKNPSRTSTGNAW